MGPITVEHTLDLVKIAVLTPASLKLRQMMDPLAFDEFNGMI